MTIIFSFKRLLFPFILLLISCNNPSSEDSASCSGPNIHNCTGDPCAYLHIFDSNGHFINEASGPATNIYWNGTDCHGRKVNCGKYVLFLYTISGGQTQVMVDTILVVDSNSISRTGRTACDSLKNNCRGNYSEAIVTVFDGYSFVKDIGCACCQ